MQYMHATAGRKSQRIHRILIWKLFAILCLLTSGAGGLAQTVTATVPTAGVPVALAVNPVTNTIYVVNSNSNNVTVIDGATNTVTATVTVGKNPVAIAVNPVNNKIYVANNNHDLNSFTVTIINGVTNATTTVSPGLNPTAIAVDPATGKVYVANFDNDNVNVGTVGVIDGATDAVTATPTAGTGPFAIAVNPATNTIYTALFGDNKVAVINGATNAVSKVTAGTKPYAIAVDPVTNKIYAANIGSKNVTVINGADNSTATVTTGNNPVAVALNPVTNKIYTANSGSGTVTVINGADNSTATVTVGATPVAIAVDVVTNQVYVADQNGSSLTVIDGATNNPSTVIVGSGPIAVGVNPVTNKIYTADNNAGSVTVVDGASNTTATVSTGTSPQHSAVNPVTNKIYVANSGSNNVTVIDANNNNATTPVTVGMDPLGVAVNPVTNKIYVSNFNSNTVTVIDGTNNTTAAPVSTGMGPLGVAVNPVTNKIYVANINSNTVTVIDGVTNTPATVNVGTNPQAVAVNPVTNKIYVTNVNSNNVTVIDGASNNTVTVNTGMGPFGIAVDTATNMIYVANQFSSNVTVIDGTTSATTTVSVGAMPQAVAVNPLTNKVYVPNFGPNNVTVIDGATNSTITVTDPNAVNPTALAVNPTTNKVYVANANSNNVSVIDGATNTITTATAGTVPGAVAVNPVTNKAYIANTTSNNVTVITEQPVNAIPLTTAITPLAGNTITNPTPATIHFTTSSSYSPTAPPVESVQYQLDTWQGPWLAAAGAAPNFTAMLSGLTPGLHILYAYADDAQQGDSIQTGNGQSGQSSPLTGAISAYEFLVVPSPSTTALALTGPNPSLYGQSLTYTATITGAGATPTGTVSFFDGTTLLGSSPLNGALKSVFTTTALAVGTHMITAEYNGDINFAESLSSPALAQTVNQAGSSTVVALTGSTPSIYGQSLTFTATVSPQFSGTPTGMVQFKDGAAPLGAPVPMAGGMAAFLTTALTAGVHSITAVYSGDGNFTSSTSAALPQTVNQATSSNVVTLTGSEPSTVGQSVTFTATVSPQFTGTPAGTVQFKDNGVALGMPVPLVNGIAMLTTSALALGTHPITAVYSGDTNFTGSTSAPYNHVVKLANANIALALTAGTPSSIYGQSLTFTATVTSASGTPTGTVQFMDGASALGAPVNLLANGTAALSTATLAVGVHSITAVYSGDANFTGATSSPLMQTVNQATSSTAVVLTAGNNPSSYGQSLTFTATVSPQFTGTATGTVQFKDGNISLGAPVALVAGSAALPISTLTVGVHSITAVYSGDTNFTASTSPALMQTVNQATSSTVVALTAGVNPSIYGQSLTFTATVSPQFTGTPTGTVQFMDGAAPLGAPMNLNAGTAVLSISTLVVGAHPITAVYSGDTNFKASTSPIFTQTVSQATSSAVVTLNAPGSNPSIYGQSLTFTATVSPQFTGTPTGTVQFMDGAVALGAPMNLNAGSAALTISTLVAGAHSITAVYSGDTNFKASTSLALAQTVNKATTTTVVTLPPGSNPSGLGQSLTFTATVSPQFSGVPTGMVQFKDGAALLGAAMPLSGATAMLTTAALTPGVHSITAVYSGDANFIGSTSAALNQTVTNQVGTTVNLMVAPSPAKFRKLVTYTATIVPAIVTGNSPTGTVTFKDGATVVGTGNVSNGQAIFTTSQLTLGKHVITASYPGDANFNGNTSVPATFYRTPRPH